MNTRKFSRNLVIVIASLVFYLVIVEIAARVYTDVILQYPSINTYDRILGWKLKKSINVHRKTRQFDYHIATNAYGLRSDEVPLEGNNNVYRILILGDSFAFGEGVELEDRFDRQLKDLIVSGKTIKVINAGVMGYGTDQELLYLTNEGLKFKPDLVILMTYENDLEDIMLDYNNTRYKPRFIIQDDKLVLTGVPIPFRSQIRDYSYIYAFFYIKFMMHNYIVPQFNAYDALPLFLKLRDTMYELCRKDHIKFVNVIFSSLKSLEGQNTAWTQPILESSSSRAIPTIDVDRLFLRHGNISRLFLHGNIHWNAEGSFLVGRLLREKIRDIVGQ